MTQNEKFHRSSNDTYSENGDVEGNNRHLLEIARALIFEIKDQSQFWDVIPVFSGNSPYNVLFPNKSLFPVVSHIFGSLLRS